MNSRLWVASGTLLAAALAASAALAQQRPGAPDPADPADPTIPVPPPAYVSAMRARAPATDDGATAPDRHWLAANEAVGGKPAHDGHAAHAGHGSHPSPQALVPAASPGPHEQHRQGQGHRHERHHPPSEAER